MERWKRLCVCLLAAVWTMGMLPLDASANSPGIPPWDVFSFENLPEETVYVDLLIPISEKDSKYTTLVERNLPENWSKSTSIVTYCEEGYRSYTFHYQDASSDFRINDRGIVTFFNDNSSSREDGGVRYKHADEIAARGDIKLALLDENGEILKVSSKFSLKPREFMTYFYGVFSYDAAADVFEADSYFNAMGRDLYAIFAFLGMLATCFMERQIAGLFGLKKQYGRLIRWTNVVSQMLMHLSYVLFYSLIFWRYTYATVILEILVYSGEYLFYHRKMKNISWKRCMAYTITANTASLFLGFLFIIVWI